MKKSKIFSDRTLVSILMALLIPSLVASCVRIQDRPLPFPASASTKTSSERALAFEDEAKILVNYGRDCGRSDEPGEEEVVKLEGEQEFSDYVDDATVFLNGWQFTYLDDDHNVNEFLALIANLRLEDGRLTWEALGAIIEDDFDSPYEFCYTYTVVGWNRRSVDVVSYNEEQLSDFGGHNHPVTNWTAEGTLHDVPEVNFNTALVQLSSYVVSSGFAAKTNAAVLPRGFDVWWRDRGIFGSDHNLLQFAYNLDHSESYIEKNRPYLQLPSPVLPSPANHFDSGFLSWDSHVIMKDNDKRTSCLGFEELISALAGSGIRMVQPPFSIHPHEDAGMFAGCVTSAGGVRTSDIAVEGLPFDYAIPVLTGWDVGYRCDDENVKTIGVWLEPDSITYDKGLTETGTLRYQVSSVLHDKDKQPGHFIRYKISVLGINARVPSDLSPAEIPGTINFCAYVPEGKLEISVTNTGVGDAPASTTRVRFEDGETVDLPTPVLKGGETVILEPIDIPASCGSDCFFTITVDTDDTVLETDEGNNTASGRCIG